MKIVAVMVSLFLIGIATETSFAGSGGNGGAGGQGGSGGRDGQSGMPGCDGGTNPSPDGKFYIPGTRQECNPSSEDRKKLDIQSTPKTK
ncbi:hypothetical protein [Phyllobacterium phragmitis]|uniref:hypothetical protein n=1 Tax=Phyllobacterium phragmitis TaxID=2670329 RepID=UPI0011B21781|nr:hypothetical protein [Phyllobacterium phragmitis]